MDQDITIQTVFDHVLGWRGVTRYNDRPIGGFETIGKSGGSEGAWPVRYSGPRLTTDPEGETIAVEILELAHQGFAP